MRVRCDVQYVCVGVGAGLSGPVHGRDTWRSTYGFVSKVWLTKPGDGFRQSTKLAPRGRRIKELNHYENPSLNITI